MVLMEGLCCESGRLVGDIILCHFLNYAIIRLLTICRLTTGVISGKIGQRKYWQEFLLYRRNFFYRRDLA